MSWAGAGKPRKEPPRIVKVFWRIGAHIFRRSALWGWTLAAICVLLYAALPGWFPGQFWLDPVRQGLLILASVAIGFVLLPELPSTLWSLDADRVRALIPGTQRDKLSQALIRAETDDDAWSDLVWEKAVEPLKLAAKEPWRYVVNMDYSVIVHLGRELTLGSRKLPVSTVSVEQTSERVLAHRGVYTSWISVVRTLDALDSEFREGECLAREHIPLGDLEGPEWQAAMIENVEIKMHIDGRPIELTPEPHANLDIVRWSAKGFDPPEERVNLRISIDGPMDQHEHTFPVKFAGYYCAGTTDISLRLYPGDQKAGAKKVKLTGSYFVGRALQSEPMPEPTEKRDALRQHLAFSTGRDGILWPGSGVLFQWNPVP